MTVDVAYLPYAVATGACAVLSFFFSGIETAMISSSEITLRSLADGGSARARRALAIITRMEEALGTTLIGNNIVNIASASFITYIAARGFLLNERELLAVSAVQVSVFLVFCEILPKVLARSLAERFLMFFSMPLLLVIRVLGPLSAPALAFSRALKRRMGITPDRSLRFNLRDEVNYFFTRKTRDEQIGDLERELLGEIMSFHEVTAGEIMIPIIDIVSVERKKSVRQLVGLIDRTNFSRIPVYEERVDNIIGYVYYRDLLQRRDARDFDGLIRRARYVPRTKRIYQLYREMVEDEESIVFVVNEYGGVEGLVTPEDIAEEIVGEIQTRDHPDQVLISSLGRNRFLLSGSLNIDYFTRRFGVPIDKKGFETIAGFIMYVLGHVPREGEAVNHAGCKFIVDAATEKSIEKVIVVIPAAKKIKK
ncbi:MAG TPA: hemolysin family protein [Spirochaetota bacterium]|nr:hemolysin family protein [Spirochaetota bacterium]HNT10402.1 hemolysin family protein [Spirochaetota bacterium]HOS39469.1 hemolysin family protein [Spirochaetota bacterium]HPI22576.1 hemolysin family protein [Spirochaetota bacterium]